MRQAGRVLRHGTIALVALFAAAVGCSSDDLELLEFATDLLQVTTDTSTVRHEEPEISPDGTRVVFATDWWSILDGGFSPRELAVIDVPIDTPYPVTNNLTNIGNTRRIIFTSPIADDSNRGEVEPERQDKASVSWHPDGERIVWVMDNSDNRSRIFIARLNLTANPISTTGDQQLLVPPEAEYFDSSPVFSPDGNWLLFSRFFFKEGRPNDVPPVPDETRPQAIYAYNMSTQEVFQVSPGSSQEDHACWSPDGSAIAFESNRDGVLEVYTIGFDGATPANMPLTSSLRRLTFTNTDPADPIPVTSFNPTWSADGTQIAFVSTRRVPTTSFRDRNLWVMAADGGNQRLLFFSREDDYFPRFHPTEPRQLVFATLQNPFEDFEGQKSDIWIVRSFDF